MSNELKNGKIYVQWSVMIVMLGILASIMGVLWGEIKSVREAESTSRADVAQIKTDVEWIKNLIQRGEVSISRTIR